MNPTIKNHIRFIAVLWVAVAMLGAGEAFAGMECEGTQYGGVYYKKGQHYYPVKNGVTYDCVACGSCSPMSNSSGPSSAMPFGAGLSPAQLMAYNLAIPLLSAALAMPEDNYADIQQQQAARQKAQQEAEQRQYLERVEQKKKLDALAAGKGDPEEDLAVALGGKGSGQTGAGEVSSGDLTPFNVSKVKAGSGPQFQQLLCAAYFSRLAEEAANNGDEDKARFMGQQAEIVMAGGTPEVQCQYPPAPDVPVPGGKEPAADTGVIAMVQRDIQDLSDIDARLQVIGREKTQLLDEKNQLEKEIASGKTGASAQKAKDDGLLLEKKKALQRKENDLAALETERAKLISRQSEIRNQLQGVKDQIQAGR
jgi:hypothetical protein